MSDSLTRTVREALAAALESNGVGRSAPDGIHSWRCEYPNVYGPCTCFAELLDDLVDAVTPRLDVAERVCRALARQRDAGTARIDHPIEWDALPALRRATDDALDAWRGGEG